MKRVSKLVLALSSTVLCLSAFAGVPNNDHPTTFLGPTLRLGFTSPLTDISAYSIAGEAGPRDFRAAMTLGLKITNNQRVKFTGEYLWQQITYAFFSGDSRQWMHQAAVGADYEYDLAYDYNPQLVLSGWWSHAPSKNLGATQGFFVNSLGVTQSYLDIRRIAGSNAGGAQPGLTAQPWQGTKVGVAANWDHVTYFKRYAPSENAYGWGGTASIDQAITDNIDLAVSAGIRKPFNDYEGQLAWHNIQYMGRWTLGLNGDYLHGKNTLPNTWTVGLSADYFFEPCMNAPMPNLKGDLKGEAVAAGPDPFLDWTADPAVHMPQVLAIVDQRVIIPDPKITCSPAAPTVIGTIPPQTAEAGTTQTIATAGAFSGSGLTFSVATSGTVPPGTTVTINPTTGVVTVVNEPDVPALFTIIVTASDTCGSASTSFIDTITTPS